MPKTNSNVKELAEFLLMCVMCFPKVNQAERFKVTFSLTVSMLQFNVKNYKVNLLHFHPEQFVVGD